MPIHEALTYIQSKVKKAVVSSDFNGNSSVEVFLDSIDKDDLKQGLYVSLLFEEEEKTLKNNDYLRTHYFKPGEPHYNPDNTKNIKGYSKVNPSIFLNLYVLILSTHSPYSEGLKQISSVISYFRRNNVFSRQRKVNGQDVDDFGSSFPSLDKLSLDLHTLTFEQNNALWQTLGSKLYPYVIYKATMVAYAEKESEPDMVPIKKVVELVKPMTEFGIVNDSDETNVAVVDEEELQKTLNKLVDDKEEDKSKRIIVINSKEVFDAIMAAIHKEKPK